MYLVMFRSRHDSIILKRNEKYFVYLSNVIVVVLYRVSMGSETFWKVMKGSSAILQDLENFWRRDVFHYQGSYGF